MTMAERLRQLLAQEGLIVAPGAYDALTARLVEQAGFPAVYMTGAGTAASHGFPDYGLLTMSEMVANAGRMAACVGVPLIADADTGYGNELNVARTVREYERLGVAAIHIEDQAFPKKCGHLDGKEIVPLDDFIAKLRAALEARRNPNFLVIARTDARAVAGFEEAIRRARAARAAGADMLFVEAPQTLEELAAVPRLVGGPCLFNLVRHGKSPEVGLSAVQAMGYRLAILPTLLLTGVIGCCEELLRQVAAGVDPVIPPQDLSVHAAFARLGADEWDALRARYREPSTARKTAAE
jgi:2-methylisocitrate lyase-like PEP mutase family enzyme